MNTIEKLQEIIKEFCDKREWNQFHNPKELAIGISTEANELLELFRFKTEEQMCEMLKKESGKEDIEDELADVFYFVLRFAQMNNINLEKALENKIKKNSEKYPIQLVKGKNLKYNEYK